jgi:hypothetical protein
MACRLLQAPDPSRGRAQSPIALACSSKAFILRAGSVESECTQLQAGGAGVGAASLRAANAASASGAACNLDRKPADAWGSGGSQRCILHASHVLCSGGTDDGAEAALAAAAAPAADAGVGGALRPIRTAPQCAAPPQQQHKQERVEAKGLLTDEFQAELEDANNCVKQLLLPGELAALAWDAGSNRCLQPKPRHHCDSWLVTSAALPASLRMFKR